MMRDDALIELDGMSLWLRRRAGGARPQPARRSRRGRRAARSQRRRQDDDAADDLRHPQGPRRLGERARASRSIFGSPHKMARRGMGHVPEDRSLFFGLTVAENLKLGLRGGACRTSAAACERALTLLPALRPLMDRRAGLLSGGEQQMLAVARAIVASAEGADGRRDEPRPGADHRRAAAADHAQRRRRDRDRRAARRAAHPHGAHRRRPGLRHEPRRDRARGHRARSWPAGATCWRRATSATPCCPKRPSKRPEPNCPCDRADPTDFYGRTVANSQTSVRLGPAGESRNISSASKPMRPSGTISITTRPVGREVVDEGLLAVLALGADPRREGWVEPRLGLVVVMDDRLALVRHRLADADLRSPTGDGEGDAWPGGDGGDTLAALRARDPEAIVAGDVVHDHADRVAGLRRPHEAALGLRVEQGSLAIAREREHRDVLVAVGVVGHRSRC